MTLARLRPIVQRLGFQVAFLLAIVLLPLTLISMVNSLRTRTEMQARSEAALTGETMIAAGNEVRLIEEGRGTAAALAAMIGPLLDDTVACSAALARIAATQPQYSQISFVPKDGQLRCSSTGKQFDISTSPIFQQFVKSARPGFAVNRNGQISGTSVLGISNPVFDQSGTYVGYIAISLPHSKLDVMVGSANLAGPLELMTFDRDGTVLVATGGLEDAARSLPKAHSLVALTSDQPLAFSDQSAGGANRVFSIVPVVPGELYLLGTWPSDSGSSFKETLVSVPFLVPALIWIASLIVAWLAVERLVNRPIRRLNSSIKSFAGGSRTMNTVDVAGAPLEIREMAAAYEQMTDAVMRDEAELEDTLHQKEVLLREVHHRVKNNLQMIASIMNMHMRKARTPETHDVIKGLQGRVMSLATIHRELYQTTGVSDIHAAELLDAIARQTVNVVAGPDRRFDLRIHLEDIRMTPDQAVPLALLVGEGLMNGVKYAGLTTAGASLLELRLTRTASDGATMQITGSIESGSIPVNDALDESVGLSTQLMTAFAMQLGGKLESSTSDGKYTMQVDFKLRPLIEAEDRHPANAKETV